jgi:hypothetical protein
MWRDATSGRLLPIRAPLLKKELAGIHPRHRVISMPPPWMPPMTSSSCSSRWLGGVGARVSAFAGEALAASPGRPEQARTRDFYRLVPGDANR